MRIPVWLTLGVAAIVTGFGIYRLVLGLRSKPADPAIKRKGLYAMRGRTHLLIGIVYLLLGAGLIATTFGWNPFGNALGPDTEPPTKDTAPTKGTLPLDQLPPKPAKQ